MTLQTPDTCDMTHTYTSDKRRYQFSLWI